MNEISLGMNDIEAGDCSFAEMLKRRCLSKSLQKSVICPQTQDCEPHTNFATKRYESCSIGLAAGIRFDYQRPATRLVKANTGELQSTQGEGVRDE